jgi:heterodisulfide reductase subunit A
VAVVSEQTCIGCMRCELVCPYGAIEQREVCTVDGHVCGHTAYVNPGVCQGCGTCQAVCLSKSVELQTFTDEQIFSEINALCAWE